MAFRRLVCFCFLETTKNFKITNPKNTFSEIVAKISSPSMSLHLFKETLKPCTNNPSSSLSSASITHSFDPIIPRKPPKSSLSRQLLRLQDPDSLPPIQSQISAKQPQGHNGDGNEEEEEEEEQKAPERKGFGRTTKLGQLQFDHTGPFEPLVLSSQNEIPVVQVII